MNPHKRHTIEDVAAALAAIVPARTLADVLNCTLSAEAEPKLTDYQVELIEVFHDALCHAAPDAMKLASGLE